MKIASCTLILTFAVYLDYVGCSSLGSGSSNVASSPRPGSPTQWEDYQINGYDVRVLRDRPETGNVIKVDFPGAVDIPTLLTVKSHIVRIVDRSENLEFVVHVSDTTGRWIAAYPMNPIYRAVLRGSTMPLIGQKRRHPDKKAHHEGLRVFYYCACAMLSTSQSQKSPSETAFENEAC